MSQRPTKARQVERVWLLNPGRWRAVIFGACASGWVLACGSRAELEDWDPVAELGGTGGVPGTGGQPNTGGLPASGGFPNNTGGLPASGGFPNNTGGLPASGGAPAVGGFPGTGGLPPIGGAGGLPITGGAPTTGGLPATGGFPSIGGTGGVPGPSQLQCLDCALSQCPATAECLLNQTCRNGTVCAFTACLAGQTFGFQCIVDCFQGDIVAASQAFATFACMASTCGQVCSQ